MSNCNRCPQCSTGKGMFDWAGCFIMRCDYCGLFVDITFSDAGDDVNDMCPCCAIEALKKDGMWKDEYFTEGEGVFCIDGNFDFLDNKTYRKEVKDYERLLLVGEIDKNISYVTKTNGRNVKFLRGSFQNILNIREERRIRIDELSKKYSSK